MRQNKKSESLSDTDLGKKKSDVFNGDFNGVCGDNVLTERLRPRRGAPPSPRGSDTLQLIATSFPVLWIPGRDEMSDLKHSIRTPCLLGTFRSQQQALTAKM